MTNRLRWRHYERDHVFDIFYFTQVFEERKSDLHISLYAIVDMFQFFKGIVFATDTQDLKAECTERHCYDDTKHPADEIWVIDHGEGESPSLYCRKCMEDREYDRSDHKTLYQTIAEIKREVPVAGIRGLTAKANYRNLRRIQIQEYVEVPNDDGGVDKKVIDWYSYSSSEHAHTAIHNYYRGKGMATLDAELMADSLIERWSEEVRKYQKLLGQVRESVEGFADNDMEVWSGTVVTSKLGEDEYCYWGNVPDIYFWVPDEGAAATTTVSFNAPR